MCARTGSWQCTNQLSRRFSTHWLIYAQVGGALAQQRAAEESAQRLSLRGSGDRSERIRTYNAPHDRVTDHRCHVTSPGVPRVLGGEIEVFVDALIQLDADERVAAFEAS